MGDKEIKVPKSNDNLDADVSKKRPQPQGRKGASMELIDYSYHRLFIYSSGTSRGNPGEAGAGVVLKTPEGEEVGRYGKYIGETNKNTAEYHSVLLGLSQAKEFGAVDVTIMSDSDLLYRQLSGEVQVRTDSFKPLFDTIQEQISSFQKFYIKLVSKNKNKDAEAMANRAIDEKL